MDNQVSNCLEPNTAALQADAQVIERMLEEIWPNVFSNLQILAWMPTAAISAEVQPYAKALCQLLDAHLCLFETTQKGRNAYNALADQAKLLKTDLVICRAHERSLFGGSVTWSSERLLIETLPASTLLPVKPRWPLKRILLAIQDQDFDEIAVIWTIRLAKPSGAHVTVLPVVTPAPKVYSHMKPDVPALMSTKCSLGRKLHRVARRLVDWEIEGTIHLREELPDDQIHCEVSEGDHDLVVIAAEPQNRLRRWMLGDLIAPLLTWADRPLLIAKPRRAQ